MLSAEAYSNSNVYNIDVYTQQEWEQDISLKSFVLMRRTDQIICDSPEGHIFLQGKKDIEFDAVQYFFVLSSFRRISDSYRNEKETSVIKHLCY